MRSGLLRRSFVALVILALASAWQVAPSFATQPCGMDNGTALAASGSCIGHCKSVAGDCTKATVCCGVISRCLPFRASLRSIGRGLRIGVTSNRSPGDTCSPIFIPPPLTFSYLAEFRAAFERCDRAGMLESTRAATAHAGRPSPGTASARSKGDAFHAS
jgi:hypothetical protein